MQQSGYRGPQACKIVGITYRQLDYWTRTGLVEASLRGAQGSGTQRLYSFNDLLQLKVIKRLTDAGASLSKGRQAIDYVRNNLEGD
ncbi:MAG TPA: MerR family transcriptional regulator, partial [Actinomycetota bacterium]|nr:MerR family transcriptional regulator [Actinomycetota bacterium]